MDVISTMNFILASRGTNMHADARFETLEDQPQHVFDGNGDQDLREVPCCKSIHIRPAQSSDESWQNKVYKMRKLILCF